MRVREEKELAAPKHADEMRSDLRIRRVVVRGDKDVAMTRRESREGSRERAGRRGVIRDGSGREREGWGSRKAEADRDADENEGSRGASQRDSAAAHAPPRP
jgi:hypothetical protein